MEKDSPTGAVPPDPTRAQQFSLTPVPQNPAAWEEIDPGRFMPRRVRGSCQGRALG